MSGWLLKEPLLPLKGHLVSSTSEFHLAELPWGWPAEAVSFWAQVDSIARQMGEADILWWMQRICLSAKKADTFPLIHRRLRSKP